jgi:hypothetical protein
MTGKNVSRAAARSASRIVNPSTCGIIKSRSKRSGSKVSNVSSARRESVTDFTRV